MRRITRKRLALTGLVALAVAIALAWAGLARQQAAQGRPRAALPEQSADVTGRIVAPDGSPVAGAQVLLVQRGNDDSIAAKLETKSDAQGRFLFPRAWPSGALYHPSIIVRAAGYGLGADWPRQRRGTFQITMHPPTSLKLTFLGPDHRPAAGVAVTVASLFGPSADLLIPEVAKREFLQKTDARGVVTIPGLPQGAGTRLIIEDSRFADLGPGGQIDLASSPVTSAGPIVLLPGATISGRVRYCTTGRPAAGIPVGAQGVEHSEWGEAVTDRDGRYTLTGLGPDRYNVAVNLKGQAAEQWTAVAHEAVPVALRDQVPGMDFELITGALITGRVVARHTHEGLPGVLIGVYGPARPQSGPWAQGCVTRPDGSYSLRVPPGPQHVYLMSEPPPGFRPPKRGEYDISLRDGQTMKLDFALRGRPMAPIRVQVLDPSAKPAAGAEVFAVPFGDVPQGASLTTDHNGRLGMDPQDIVLFARQGRDATPKGYHVTRGGEVMLRLRRDALASVAGQVVDSQGNAAPNATVQILFWGTPAKGSVGIGGTLLTVTTGPDGGYVVPYLWPNQPYSATIPDPASPRRAADREDFQLKPGERKVLRPLRKP